MSILKKGSVINNYNIVQELDKNPLGNSYLAQKSIFNPNTGKSIIKEYTIKSINLNKIGNLGLNPNVIEEQVKLLTNLSENPICSLYISCYYDYFTHSLTDANGEINNYIFIVTDYINGISLQQLILQNSKTGFEMNDLIQKMFEIAEAVDYLHTHGIAHQNIKPSNIILDSVTNRLRIVDLAFSCSMNINSECKGKAGTAYYMPPELLQLPVDPSSQDFYFRTSHDIWSMGVVFYQMANLGQDFMNFESNDPDIIAKDIQIQNVNPSNNSYIPINSVIDAILVKDYLIRPTSGQVVIILRLARPLCIVNGVQYDREEAEAIITSLGFNINPDTNDYTICKLLTDSLGVCKLNNNDYQKKHLLKLAKMIGLTVDENIESVVLCDTIQKGLQMKNESYSRYITNEIMRALSYMSWILVRSEMYPSDELSIIGNQIQERYNNVFIEAQKLDLINLKILESQRQEATLKSLVYATNASVSYAKVYSTMANLLIDAILTIDKDFQVGGIPLEQFKFI